MFNRHCAHHSPWLNLKPFWDWGGFIADQRHGQKQSYDTHNPMNKLPDHVGVRGEMVYSTLTGLAMDWRLRAEGDGGIDFSDGTGVKASTADKPRYHLIEYAKPKHWSERYVLVIIDEQKRRGCLVGWETGEAMQKAPVENFGYGPRLAIAIEKLRPWYTIPSVIARANALQRRSVHIIKMAERRALLDAIPVEDAS